MALGSSQGVLLVGLAFRDNPTATLPAWWRWLVGGMALGASTAAGAAGAVAAAASAGSALRPFTAQASASIP